MTSSEREARDIVERLCNTETDAAPLPEILADAVMEIRRLRSELAEAREERDDARSRNLSSVEVVADLVEEATISIEMRPNRPDDMTDIDRVTLEEIRDALLGLARERYRLKTAAQRAAEIAKQPPSVATHTMILALLNTALREPGAEEPDPSGEPDSQKEE